ncbi:MAG: NnrS family protein, partial [Candidatus Wenzhouxiangella sp. M2_3B_020]
VYAVIVMIGWIGVFLSGWGMAGVQPLQWHAHEMIYGVTAAAIAGFLLTAVPNWTGTERVHGKALAGLWLLWLAGRIAFWVLDPNAAGFANLAGAVVDLLFLPALAVAVARPIVATGNYRNLSMTALLAGLFAANLVLAFGPPAQAATVFALDLILIMMVIIGGRITPLFTRNWLNRRGLDGENVRSHAWLDRLALSLAVLTALATLLPAPSTAVGGLAFAAGLAHFARLIEWQGWRAWRDPLVWVLHLGYAWIVVALLIRGIGEFTPAVPARAWFHALGVGAIGTLLVGVMSRVTLGHTGRPLVLATGASSIYWAMTVAAVARTGHALGWFGHAHALNVAAAAWIVSFALFALYFVPKLISPRADGRVG